MKHRHKTRVQQTHERLRTAHRLFLQQGIPGDDHRCYIGRGEYFLKGDPLPPHANKEALFADVLSHPMLEQPATAHPQP